jgi:hypothetical protein
MLVSSCRNDSLRLARFIFHPGAPAATRGVRRHDKTPESVRGFTLGRRRATSGEGGSVLKLRRPTRQVSFLDNSAVALTGGGLFFGE